MARRGSGQYFGWMGTGPVGWVGGVNGWTLWVNF